MILCIRSFLYIIFNVALIFLNIFSFYVDFKTIRINATQWNSIDVLFLDVMKLELIHNNLTDVLNRRF